MGRGIAAGVAIGAVVGACFTKPDAPTATGSDDAGTAVDATDSGSPGDAPIDPGDAPVGPCTTHDFEINTTGCGSLGSGSGSAGSAYVSAGRLVIALQTGTSSMDCQTTTARKFVSATLEVASLNGLNYAETHFGVVVNSGSQYGVRWTSGPKLHYDCLGTVGPETNWNPTDRFVRLSRSGDTLRIEAGSALGQLTEVDTCSTPAGSLDAATIVVGASDGSASSPGNSAFEWLEQCP